MLFALTFLNMFQFELQVVNKSVFPERKETISSLRPQHWYIEIRSVGLAKA